MATSKIEQFFKGISDTVTRLIQPKPLEWIVQLCRNTEEDLAIKFLDKENLEEFLKKIPSLSNYRAKAPKDDMIHIPVLNSQTGGVAVCFPDVASASFFAQQCQSDLISLQKLDDCSVLISPLDKTIPSFSVGYSVPCKLGPASIQRQYALTLQNHTPTHTKFVMQDAANGSIGLHDLPSELIRTILSKVADNDPLIILSILARVSKAWHQYSQLLVIDFFRDQPLQSDRQKFLMTSDISVFMEQYLEKVPKESFVDMPVPDLKSYTYLSEATVKSLPVLKEANKFFYYFALNQLIFYSGVPDNYVSIHVYKNNKQADRYIFAVTFEPSTLASYIPAVRAMGHAYQALKQEFLYKLNYRLIAEHSYHEDHNGFYFCVDKFLFSSVTLTQPKQDSVSGSVYPETVAKQVSGMLGTERQQERDAFSFMEVVGESIILSFVDELFPRDLACAFIRNRLNFSSALSFAPVDIQAKTFIDEHNREQNFIMRSSITISGKEAAAQFLKFCGFKQEFVDIFLPQLQAPVPTLASTAMAGPSTA